MDKLFWPRQLIFDNHIFREALHGGGLFVLVFNIGGIG
jgi:hypothetical protein